MNFESSPTNTPENINDAENERLNITRRNFLKNLLATGTILLAENALPTKIIAETFIPKKESENNPDENKSPEKITDKLKNYEQMSKNDAIIFLKKQALENSREIIYIIINDYYYIPKNNDCFEDFCFFEEKGLFRLAKQTNTNVIMGHTHTLASAIKNDPQGFTEQQFESKLSDKEKLQPVAPPSFIDIYEQIKTTNEHLPIKIQTTDCGGVWNIEIDTNNTFIQKLISFAREISYLRNNLRDFLDENTASEIESFVSDSKIIDIFKKSETKKDTGYQEGDVEKIKLEKIRSVSSEILSIATKKTLDEEAIAVIDTYTKDILNLMTFKKNTDARRQKIDNFIKKGKEVGVILTYTEF